MLLMAILAIWLTILSWCSMMPDDDEIIKWSVLENEIFWDELVDDGLDENAEWENDVEWIDDVNVNVWDDENDISENEEDEYTSNEVGFEVVE